MHLKDKDCSIILIELKDMKEDISHLKLGVDAIVQHLGNDPSTSTHKDEAHMMIRLNNDSSPMPTY